MVAVLIENSWSNVWLEETGTDCQQDEGDHERSHTISGLKDRWYRPNNHDDVRDTADQYAQQNSLEATKLSICEPAARDGDHKGEESSVRLAFIHEFEPYQHSREQQADCHGELDASAQCSSGELGTFGWCTSAIASFWKRKLHEVGEDSLHTVVRCALCEFHHTKQVCFCRNAVGDLTE